MAEIFLLLLILFIYLLHLQFKSEKQLVNKENMENIEIALKTHIDLEKKRLKNNCNYSNIKVNHLIPCS